MLIVVYVANLVYTLVTHRDIFAIDDPDGGIAQPAWALPLSIGVLLAATVFTALEAELVSGALEATAARLAPFQVLSWASSCSPSWATFPKKRPPFILRGRTGWAW